MLKIFTLSSLALFCNLVYATVHYTYVGNGVYNPGQSFRYDLDADGDDDFSIYCDQSDNNYYVSGLKSSSYFAVNANNIPKAYSENAALGTYQWQTGDGLLVESGGGNAGLFKSVNKYLMVKFENTSGQTLYGWFHLIGEVGVIVSAYAYEDVPGQNILAGQTTTGINDLTQTANLLAIVSNNSIIFTDTRNFDKAEVYDIQGKQLLEIATPEQSRSYPLGADNQVLVIAVYSGNRYVASAKYYNW